MPESTKLGISKENCYDYTSQMNPKNTLVGYSCLEPEARSNEYDKAMKREESYIVSYCHCKSLIYRYKDIDWHMPEPQGE